MSSRHSNIARKSDKPFFTNAGPKIGSKWHRPGTRGYGFVIEHPAETRHVVERTLGGDVYFVSGRLTRFAHRERCTLVEWRAWIDSGLAPVAREVK